MQPNQTQYDIGNSERERARGTGRSTWVPHGQPHRRRRSTLWLLILVVLLMLLHVRIVTRRLPVGPLLPVWLRRHPGTIVVSIWRHALAWAHALHHWCSHSHRRPHVVAAAVRSEGCSIGSTHATTSIVPVARMPRTTPSGMHDCASRLVSPVGARAARSR